MCTVNMWCLVEDQFPQLCFCCRLNFSQLSNWGNHQEEHLGDSVSMQIESWACIQFYVKGLSWLSVRQRIVYKTAMLVYSSRQHHSPDYLNELNGDCKPQRALRSSSERQLQQPLVKLSFSDRTFAAAAPRTWNSLTVHTKSAETVDVLKSRLKTDMFTVAYDC
jgi:hypothetical protein